MAWCHQATSHYLSQCWRRSLLPYGVTRPQCVKTSPLILDIIFILTAAKFGGWGYTGVTMFVSLCVHPLVSSLINSSPPEQNGCHFYDIFRYICVNEKFQFHWSLFRGVHLYTSIGLDNGLVPNRQQAIIWSNGDPIHWHIYAALGGDVLSRIIRYFWKGGNFPLGKLMNYDFVPPTLQMSTMLTSASII